MKQVQGRSQQRDFVLAMLDFLVLFGYKLIVTRQI